MDTDIFDGVDGNMFNGVGVGLGVGVMSRC